METSVTQSQMSTKACIAGRCTLLVTKNQSGRLIQVVETTRYELMCNQGVMLI